MKIDLTPLTAEQKLLFEVSLKPIQGHRFQPTGFPDLGAATFQIPSGQALLVESAQSMANRLEGVCWNHAENVPVGCLSGISYVRVEREGEYLTSTLTEPHRLNSVYVKRSSGGKMYKQLVKDIAYKEGNPVDFKKLAYSLMKYDVNSLIHGVFLESIAGRLRIPRSLSSFIEAEKVTRVDSGGVKFDHIDPGKTATLPEVSKEVPTKKDDERRGNVPFHREEYTSEKITCYVNLDLGQIRGYGLGDDATRLLILLSLYKIRALLDGDLRLRTACDFQVLDKIITANRPDGFDLPSLADLESDLPEAVEAGAGDMEQTTVQFKN